MNFRVAVGLAMFLINASVFMAYIRRLLTEKTLTAMTPFMIIISGLAAVACLLYALTGIGVGEQ